MRLRSSTPMRHALPGLALAACAFAATAATVSKAEWMDGMSTVLPTAFCAPAQYYRQCFEVTAPQCEEAAASATRVCLARHRDEIPAVLNQPQDGTRWGTVVGQCAGRAYEIALLKQRRADARCNDPSQWK